MWGRENTATSTIDFFRSVDFEGDLQSAPRKRADLIQGMGFLDS
jgi:hypothetical protein